MRPIDSDDNSPTGNPRPNVLAVVVVFVVFVIVVVVVVVPRGFDYLLINSRARTRLL